MARLDRRDIGSCVTSLLLPLRTSKHRGGIAARIKNLSVNRACAHMAHLRAARIAASCAAPRTGGCWCVRTRSVSRGVYRQISGRLLSASRHHIAARRPLRLRFATSREHARAASRFARFTRFAVIARLPRTPRYRIMAAWYGGSNAQSSIK